MAMPRGYVDTSPLTPEQQRTLADFDTTMATRQAARDAERQAKLDATAEEVRAAEQATTEAEIGNLHREMLAAYILAGGTEADFEAHVWPAKKQEHLVNKASDKVTKNRESMRRFIQNCL